MAVFDIDEEMAFEAITSALEDAGAEISEDQFIQIVNAIEDSMPGVIEVLTIGMAEHWKSEAMSAGGWGTKYAQAILHKFEGGKGEVYLDEDETVIDKGSGKPNFMFAMMMEKGVKSWSIKDALMNSEKAKVGKDGVKYITIPFPVATPRKQSQGKMATQFGKREMTQEMHKIVKAGGKLKSGAVTARGKEISVAGLSKYTTRKLHSQYGMFRRVSENSKGWQYPNKAPRPIFQSVLSEVNKRVHEVMTEFSRAIVKEYTQ